MIQFQFKEVFNMFYEQDFDFKTLHPAAQILLIVLGVIAAIPLTFLFLTVIGIIMAFAFAVFCILMVYAIYVDYVRTK
jgi:hypothetical protein